MRVKRQQGARVQPTRLLPLHRVFTDCPFWDNLKVIERVGEEFGCGRSYLTARRGAATGPAILRAKLTAATLYDCPHEKAVSACRPSAKRRKAVDRNGESELNNKAGSFGLMSVW